MITPYAPSPPQYYCRLFPADTRVVDENLLMAVRRLGETMRSQPGGNRSSPIPAGYTYFGQFVDHDLTWDPTPLADANPEVGRIINQRTPRLDLDHIYGDGPGSTKDGSLYESDGASLRLGAVRLKNGQPFDVLLDENQNPLLADPRNSENLILRQVHAMFVRLHNLAVQELGANEDFEMARDRVRWQYQWLVRHDYLPRICAADVYAEVIRNGRLQIDFRACGFSIPVEFAQGAFRFGHSMVRSQYVLNTDADEALEPGESPILATVDLETIFAEAHRPGPLSPSRRVDWSRFLGVAQGRHRREFAMLIDTEIVGPLFQLPPERVFLFVRSMAATEISALPLRTLLRGAMTQLPTGENVAAALGLPPLRANSPPEVWKPLDDAGLTDATPLWYYVLLEAQLQTGGQTLGRLGSILVANIIENALREDPNSFLNRNAVGWTPPPWTDQQGGSVTVGALHDVARLLNLA